jgi:predicted tellurium resistance membrane protein TerC
MGLSRGYPDAAAGQARAQGAPEGKALPKIAAQGSVALSIRIEEARLMPEMLMTPVFWGSLATVTFLEILLGIMVAAVVLSTNVMAVAADPLSKFITQDPTTKMLAPAFILLAGAALLADGPGFHIPRGYLCFAIAFSLGVELFNIRTRKTAEARVKVH